jgi:hypothetical protein
MAAPPGASNAKRGCRETALDWRTAGDECADDALLRSDRDAAPARERQLAPKLGGACCKFSACWSEELPLKGRPCSRYLRGGCADARRRKSVRTLERLQNLRRSDAHALPPQREGGQNPKCPAHQVIRHTPNANGPFYRVALSFGKFSRSVACWQLWPSSGSGMVRHR